MTLLAHVHELDAGEGTLRRIERLKPEPWAGDSLPAAMILFNGLITPDTFCLSRPSPSRLHWTRRPPLRRAPSMATRGDLHDDIAPCGGAHATSVAQTSAVPRDGGRR